MIRARRAETSKIHLVLRELGHFLNRARHFLIRFRKFWKNIGRYKELSEDQVLENTIAMTEHVPTRAVLPCFNFRIQVVNIFRLDCLLLLCIMLLAEYCRLITRLIRC